MLAVDDEASFRDVGPAQENLAPVQLGAVQARDAHFDHPVEQLLQCRGCVEAAITVYGGAAKYEWYRCHFWGTFLLGCPLDLCEEEGAVEFLLGSN